MNLTPPTVPTGVRRLCSGVEKFHRGGGEASSSCALAAQCPRRLPPRCECPMTARASARCDGLPSLEVHCAIHVAPGSRSPLIRPKGAAY